MEHLQVPFGEELVDYAVGRVVVRASPGCPAGLDVLWRAQGRLPWERLVEPALAPRPGRRRDAGGPRACLQMLAPVMTMREGARIYEPGGALLAEGDVLQQPGLVAALELIRDEGAPLGVRGDDRRRVARARRRARRRAPRGRSARLRGRVWTGPARGGVRGAARRHAGGPLRRSRDAGALRPVGGGRRRCSRRCSRSTRGRAHDQRDGRRRRRQRLRADDEPRSRLRRLGAGPRPAPEQHARRGRPRPRDRSCRTRGCRA